MVKYNFLTICTVRIEFVSIENSVRKFVIRDAPFWYILRPAVNWAPGLLLLSFGSHDNAWRGICLSSIWCTCPSHCSHIFLRMTCTVSIPFSILSFHCWFYLSMWFPVSYIAICEFAPSNHFIFTTVMFYVSAAYRSVDISSVSYSCIYCFSKYSDDPTLVIIFF